MRPSCLFRFDASTAIGGGHAVRCLALAQAMAQEGWDCRFAYREGTAETVPTLAAIGQPAIRLTGPESAEPAALSAALPEGVTLLVVDHYERGRAYERACRGWAQHIAALDDRPTRPHDCDILIDPTLGREAADYRSLVPAGCTLLTGTDYAILRPAFARARKRALERRGTPKPVQRILVSFGMADPENLSGLALAAIAESGLHAAVDVVLGAEALHRAAIEAAHRALPGGGAVHAYVEDMAALMLEADFAIGAAGSSAWERCCLGLPTLHFVLADNQHDIALGLEQRGAAENLGPPDGGAADRLAARIAALGRQPEALAQMGRAAAAVCDGQGSGRLIEAFAALSNAHASRPLA